MKSLNTFYKLLCAFLVLVMLVGAAGVPTFAEEEAVVTLGTPLMAAPGDTMEVPIKISGMKGLCVVQFALTYDTDILTYVSHEKGDLINKKGSLEVNCDAEAGKIYFIWDYTSALTSSEGTLITFRFTVQKKGLARIGVDEAEDFIFAAIESGYNYRYFEPTVAFGAVAVPDYILPANLTSIDAQAFAGVAASVVYIPENVTSISADAFDDSVTLVCKKASSTASAAANLSNTFIEIP